MYLYSTSMYFIICIKYIFFRRGP